MRIAKWKVLGLFPWVATARQEALLSFKGKVGLLKAFLTCYIKNCSFLNLQLPSLNQNSNQQKLHKCYFKNLWVTKCLLTYTHFPRNSLFFRICKATCKIGLFAFQEPLIFSPSFHFPLIFPFLPVTTTYTRCATKHSQQCYCERPSEGAIVSEPGTGLSTPALFSKSSLPSYYHVSISSVCVLMQNIQTWETACWGIVQIWYALFSLQKCLVSSWCIPLVDALFYTLLYFSHFDSRKLSSSCPAGQSKVISFHN